MNKIIITGRICNDPELRQTQSGISACRFTVATNRKFKDKDSGEYKADFINCTAWRQTAEFISKYFSKGSMIAIEGTLQNSNYEKDGVKHYSYVVTVENVEFCGSKDSGSTAASQPSQTAQQTDTGYGDLSDFEEILSEGGVPF